MIKAFLNLKVRVKLILLFSVIIILTSMVSGYAAKKMYDSVLVADKVHDTLELRYGRTDAAQDALFDLHAMIQTAIKEKEVDSRAVEEYINPSLTVLKIKKRYKRRINPHHSVLIL